VTFTLHSPSSFRENPAAHPPRLRLHRVTRRRALDPEAAREGLHALAASGPRVAVAWLDLRGSGTELWAALSENGGATW